MMPSKDTQVALGANKAEPPTSLILRSAGLEVSYDRHKARLTQIDSPLASANNSIILGVSHIDFNDNNLTTLEGIQAFRGIIH